MFQSRAPRVNVVRCFKIHLKRIIYGFNSSVNKMAFRSGGVANMVIIWKYGWKWNILIVCATKLHYFSKISEYLGCAQLKTTRPVTFILELMRGV